MSKAQELYVHAKTRIPGGVQLLSKRPEQFTPGQRPSYFTKARGCEVWKHAEKMGKRLIDAWNTLAKKHDIPAEAGGMPCLAHITYTKYPLELKTLYTVLMLKEGFLGNNGFYPTLAHTDKIMAKYEKAIDRVFAKMSEVLKKDDYNALLEAIGGPVCQSGFARLLK